MVVHSICTCVLHAPPLLLTTLLLRYRQPSAELGPLSLNLEQSLANFPQANGSPLVIRMIDIAHKIRIISFTLWFRH